MPLEGIWLVVPPKLGGILPHNILHPRRDFCETAVLGVTYRGSILWNSSLSTSKPLNLYTEI